MELTHGVLAFKPLSWMVYCYALVSKQKVENPPLWYFGPSWLTYLSVQTAISLQVGFHNGKNRSFPLALLVCALCQELRSLICWTVQAFLYDAREQKNSLCPRGKRASSTLCHRVLSSSSSSSWLEAWTGKSFLDSCFLHVPSRVCLLWSVMF